MSVSRAFTWDDIGALHALVQERWTVDGPHGQRRIGDMWWVLRNTPAGYPLRHMQVWTRGDGSLAACAFLDPPAMGDVIVAPGAEDAFAAAFSWLEEEHKVAGSGNQEIVVLAGDAQRAAELSQRGYLPTAAGNVRLWRELKGEANPVTLPDGYAFTPVSTPKAMDQRARVEALSFGNDSLDASAWAALLSRLPNYRVGLDVLAAAPNGSGASACTNFYEPDSHCGELEAVGTAPAHRRRGVGKAVTLESLRRLQHLGAQCAIVETTISNAPAIALYTSCGFIEVARDYAWSKVAAS